MLSVSGDGGDKTDRMDICVYLGFLDWRLDNSTITICTIESQRRNLVAHRSKRLEVTEQGPVMWLQPEASGWRLPEEWLMGVYAERLKKLESGVPE